MVSLATSLVSPQAQARIARSNLCPSHHGGYNPVTWKASSIAEASVLPVWLPAMSNRSRYFAPAAWNSACFG